MGSNNEVRELMAEVERARRRIIGRNARIADLDHTLRVPQMSAFGKPRVIGNQHRAAIERERAELLYANDRDERWIKQVEGCNLEPTNKRWNDPKKKVAEISEPAPGIGLPIVDLHRPVAEIAQETKRAALAKGAPYRKVPDLSRVLKAVDYKKRAGCTYPEASNHEFGNPDHADRVRYWTNKRARGEQ